MFFFFLCKSSEVIFGNKILNFSKSNQNLFDRKFSDSIKLPKAHKSFFLLSNKLDEKFLCITTLIR